MKRYTHIGLLCIFLTLFCSCTNDDGSNVLSREDLIGSWSPVSLESNAVVSFQIAEVESSVVTEAVGSNFDYVVTFTETEYTAMGSYDLSYTIDQNGATVTNSETIEIAQSGTYELTENGTLTLDGELYTINGNTIDIDGLDIDPNTHFALNVAGQLVVTQDYEGAFSQDENVLSYDVDSTFVLEKLE